MRYTLPVFVLVLLAAALFWLMSDTNSDIQEGEGPERNGESATLQSPTLDGGTPGDGREMVTNEGPGPTAAHLGPDLEPASLELTVIDLSGQAVAGATAAIDLEPARWRDFGATLWGAEVTDYRLQPSRWQGPSARADEQGRIRLEGGMAGRELILTVGGPLHSAVSLPVRELAKNEQRDLGTIALAAGHVVEGKVVDAQDRPVPGAQLLLFEAGMSALALTDRVSARSMTRFSTLANAEGGFRFPGVAPGDYSVAVHAPGFRITQGDRLALRGEPRVHTIEIRVEVGGVLSGTVLDGNGGPVAGTRIAASHADGFLGGSWFEADQVLEKGFAVRPDGRFRIAGLDPDKSYILSAVAPEYGMTESKELKPGDEVDLVLQSALVLPGRVVQQGGTPVEGALVELLPADRGGTAPFFLPPTDESAADGSFAILAPSEGRFKLRVRSFAGATTKVEDVELRAGMDPIEVIVEGQFPVVVQLSDESGAGLAGEWIELRAQGRRNAARPTKARTNEQGEARFYSLEAGYYHLTAKPSGFAEAQHRFKRDGDVEQFILMTAQAPGSVRLSVVTADGDPAIGFPVRLSSTLLEGARIELEPRYTDSQGLVSWSAVPPGSYLATGDQPGSPRIEPWREVGSDDRSEAPREIPASSVEVNVVAGQVSEAQLRLIGHLSLEVFVQKASVPVEGVLIYLMPRNVRGGRVASLIDAIGRGRTDGDGLAYLPPALPGNYRLVVNHGPDRVPLIRDVELKAGQQTHNISLPTGKLRGIFVGGAGSIAGAEVQIAPTGNNRPTVLVLGPGQPGAALQYTDDQGGFEFDEVPEGQYIVSIRHPGIKQWTSDPTRHDGFSVVDLGVVQLEPAGALRGKVLNLQNHSGGEENLFAFHMVTLMSADGRQISVDVLQEDGAYEFENLLPGSYFLQVEFGENKWSSPQVQVQTGTEPTEFDFRLP